MILFFPIQENLQFSVKVNIVVLLLSLGAEASSLSLSEISEMLQTILYKCPSVFIIKMLGFVNSSFFLYEDVCVNFAFYFSNTACDIKLILRY